MLCSKDFSMCHYARFLKIRSHMRSLDHKLLEGFLCYLKLAFLTRCVPACTWFLKIDSVWTPVCVRVCVCVSTPKANNN